MKSEQPFAQQYADHVNPQWVRLLDLLEMNVAYRHCLGVELTTVDGRRILDFLSGYCVYNMGHNHPAIIAALKAELDSNGPSMLQNHVPQLAGVLAERLCRLAGGRLARVAFGSSGSEGVEAAIKFSRMHTGRTGMLYCDGAFHGLTCGALSLMGGSFWSDGFGPMLPDTTAIPFNDLAALDKKLATKKFAAFIVEPIQSEAGIVLPANDYLREAERLCRRSGTLLVLDEVQTGMYRTGPFLAAHHYGVEPDMVVMAKALSGGLVPVGALLMTEKVCDSVFKSLKSAMIHTSTFSENSLAMRAALASLDVMAGEKLGERGTAMGRELRDKLQAALSGYEMFQEVRGIGMMSGIKFRAPRSLKLKVAFETFKAIHPGMFGQMLVLRLFRDKGFITQICGNDFMVLKASPPLVATTEHIDGFVAAIKDIVDSVHTSDQAWSEAIGMARRTMNI
ncbi:MAG: aspartate aminotransferase family protein [Candidatus Omnitrophota bacterium]